MSVRVHPILSGEIQLRVMEPRRPRRGPAKLPRTLLRSFFRKPGWFPVPVFLVEHPGEGALLFDVGYDPSVNGDPAKTLGFFFGKVAMSHRFSTDVREEVRSRGVDPEQVATIVMSHLHLDHASGAHQWPGATFVVDRVEREAALSQRGPGPYVKPHLEKIERWHEIDFDGPGAEPFESFSRTVDLLGDGTVRLISSQGHSPGHLSLLLRLRDRYALLLGDAMMSTRELHDRLIDGLIVNQDEFLRSGDETRAFFRNHPDTVVIPSHDVELWPKLESVYE